MKNFEQELKLQLDEREYNILADYAKTEPQLQTNYYFCYPDMPADVIFLSAVDRIRVPTTMIEAMEIEKRLAVCGVQNSRGFLLHSVKLSGDAKKIENYSILTPTEINVTQSPWFKDTLKKIRVNYAEHLKKVTQFVTLSFDPCAQYRIEIENA